MKEIFITRIQNKRAVFQMYKKHLMYYFCRKRDLKQADMEHNPIMSEKYVKF